MPSVKFMYQIIFNVCIDFHILIKYLLRVYSVSWAVLNMGIQFITRKTRFLLFRETIFCLKGKIYEQKSITLRCAKHSNRRRKQKTGCHEE